MRSLKKTTGTAVSIPAGLALGTLVSMAVTMAGALTIAWMLDRQHLQEGSIGYGTMVVIAVSAVSGTLTAVGKIKRVRLQTSLLAGLCYFLSLLAITALFFGGRYEAVGTTVVIVAVSSVAVAFLPGKGRGRGKFPGKRYR